MFRNISADLKKWKDAENRKPLLVRGARQVGKSYSISEFGKKHFEGDVHILNFEKYPEVHAIFEQNFDTNRIIGELELFLNARIVAGEDLLFFDEIQECPKAIMALRYFYEEKPELHVVAAGSLLEFALQDISFPVGRLQVLNMHPMSFAEYLRAVNNELLAEKLSEKTEFSQTILDKLNDALYSYFIVGGMPECVKTYKETGSYIPVIDIQNDLLVTFRQDFSKYAGHSDKRCLNAVLNSVALKVGEQIKYTALSADFSNPTIKKAFDLLETARLFSKVRAASPAGLPLRANASDKKFKAVFLDIGLVSCINGFHADRKIDKQNFTSGFNGSMAEQFVGQELKAQSDNLFYWTRDARGSSAEVDYLLSRHDQIIPIEVKSGKSGKLKSLHLLLEKYKDIETAYVLTEDKYGDIPEQKLKFLPLVHAGNLV